MEIHVWGFMWSTIASLSMCPPTSTCARGEGRVISHTASVVIIYTRGKGWGRNGTNGEAWEKMKERKKERDIV